MKSAPLFKGQQDRLWTCFKNLWKRKWDFYIRSCNPLNLLKWKLSSTLDWPVKLLTLTDQLHQHQQLLQIQDQPDDQQLKYCDKILQCITSTQELIRIMISYKITTCRYLYLKNIYNTKWILHTIQTKSQGTVVLGVNTLV